MATMNALGNARRFPDFASSFLANSTDLDGVLARDVASLDMELERARALVAVSNNGYELKNMSEQWRADRGVVLAAVRQCGEALRFTSSELVQDSIVVLAAVHADPSALRFAAQHFEGDKHVVMAAVRKDPGAIEFANAPAKRDPEVFFHALSTEVLQYLHAATGVHAAGGVSAVDGPDLDFTLLRHFDQQLRARFSTAVMEWLARLVANGDEEAARRQQRIHAAYGYPLPLGVDIFSRLSSVDIAECVVSKLDRRKALMVVHRGSAQILPLALKAKVLDYL